MAYPEGDDRAGLRAMIEASVEGDAMGVNARRDGDTVRFEYPAVVLVAVEAVGWVKRKRRPNTSRVRRSVGSSLTLDPTYVPQGHAYLPRG